MTQDIKTTGSDEKAFYYTEECGLALMMHPRTGKRVGLDKDLWTEMVTAIQTESHPGAKPPYADDGRS